MKQPNDFKRKKKDQELQPLTVGNEIKRTIHKLPVKTIT